ncbi:MAG: HAD-IIIC family phosphatase [Bacteroidales bacterium]|jgi:FkbH-like protein|nr:HAD-IIIC family phosphatase [Bacteroidales bacterium]
MKLAVLSNVNMDPLRFCFQKNNALELYFCGYNRWQAELLDTNSELHKFAPDYVFLYLNAGEWNGEISGLLASVKTYLDYAKTTNFIIANFNYLPTEILINYDNDSYVNLLNKTMNDFSKENHQVTILDFNRIIRWFGYKNLFDEKYWYLGRIKLSNEGFKVLANEITHVLNCLQGKTKKVLVLDLDNTLWGGILGEDGMNNLLLSEEGIGRIFADFQKKIKQLKEMGVLLVSCSKNNEPEVMEMFEKHPNMLLQWEDFILHKINWERKSDNIAEVAKTLQLGLDSMVFIDDSRQERELLKQLLPEVETPDFPEDISLLNQWFVWEVVYPFFPKKQLTEEDKEKTIQYKRNLSRKNEELRTMNYEEFLASLQIKLNISELADFHISRVAQLTQKTNQFNLSGKRYTEAEISAMASDKNSVFFICDYEDKFGKEGIIGCAIVHIEEKKAVIENLLLSCRVLGREVENLFLQHILSDLKEKSICKVEGIFRATEKNIAAKDFYLKNGFIPINEQCYLFENL